MRNSRFLPIVLVVSIDMLGFAIVIPLLPFYAEHYGANAAVVGLLPSIYAVFSLLGAPLLERWSGHYGRKPVLLVSQFDTCAGFVVLTLAPSLACSRDMACSGRCGWRLRGPRSALWRRRLCCRGMSDPPRRQRAARAASVGIFS